MGKKISKKEMVDIQRITPAIAAQMLGNRVNARPISLKTVDEISRDINAGNFHVNTDAIGFDKNGVLFNGQARLTAIIQTNKTLNIIVAKNMSDAAKITANDSRRQTAGSKLYCDGHKSAGILARSLKVLNALAHGERRMNLTSMELFAAVERHPDLKVSVQEARKSKVAQPWVMAAIHYIGHYTGYPDEANDFLHTLRTGQSKSKKDPAFVARKMLIDIRMTEDTLSLRQTMEILVAAWEAKRTGKTVTKIKPRDGVDHYRVEGWDLDAFLS